MPREKTEHRNLQSDAPEKNFHISVTNWHFIFFKFRIARENPGLKNIIIEDVNDNGQNKSNTIQLSTLKKIWHRSYI